MIKSIVLLPTILSVLLPSLPNGNNFNPPIQNADPVSIIQWDIDDATRTNTFSIIANSYEETWYASTSKYNINKSTDYINIKETTYTQTIQRKDNVYFTLDLVNYYDYGTIRYETSTIIITEITTYSGITNNIIDYEISLLNNNHLSSSTYKEINANIIQYKTNNDLSKYINQTNYSILNNQLAIFTDITNNYSYTQTKDINDITIDQNYQLNTEIQLNNIWKTYMITYIKWIDTSFEELRIFGMHLDSDLITMDTGEIFGIIHIPTGYEVVDIPTLMFTILTLPFSFITQAFNITLFPNTPYSINIGNLFLSIVAIILLMWLLQKIIGFFAKS